MNNLELIDRAKRNALAGRILDRDSIISLLKIDPKSEDGEKLGQVAREVASEVCKDRAYLWGAIGIDYKACSMSCDYCSLGEKWGLVKGESEFTKAEVIDIVRKYVDEGVRWIVLRATEFYSLDRLMELAAEIRRAVPGEYELGANAGEFDEETAGKMSASGLEFIYHAVRLREGADTRFDPEDRLATMDSVKRSSLKLVSFAEPIGVEHTDEEIADSLINTMDYDTIIAGGMARVPVAGTPLGKYPSITEERLAQIAAVARLAAGRSVPDISVHPPSELALRWGANVLIVEKGSIPRYAGSSSSGEWNGFDTGNAKEWFGSNGYTIYNKGE